MISIRPVLTDADIDIYLDVRNRVHPQTPLPREAVLHQRRKPDNLDLIAELDGVPVGAASSSKFSGAPNGRLAFMTIRVLREEQRKGVGTALYGRGSEHARELGKRELFVMARADDVDSLAYYGARGFEERGRMQDVLLDLASVNVAAVQVPDGVEVVRVADEHERGIYAVALEADADIPSSEPLVTGSFEEWRERLFGEPPLRDLSFVALQAGVVVGYAMLGRHTSDTAEHWMTGVARSARGRGVALALKQTQIAAAKDAGWAYLRTQNDLGNAAMRRVNEKLGYERRFEWVDLFGPLLD